MTVFMAATLAQVAMPSTARLGVAEGQCRPGEHGPALLIAIEGLKDRVGMLRAEIYPPNDTDFLADDNLLLSAGKVFRRGIVDPIPPGPVRLCLRVPAPGAYALTVVHARTGRRGFSLLHDGIGFGGNPRLGYAKPRAAAATVVVGPSPTATRVVMNYRTGLVSFGPLRR